MSTHFEKVSFEQFKKNISTMDNNASDYESIYNDITLPKRGTTGSAGYDFVAPYDITITPGESVLIPTGIRASMNKDLVLVIVPRSSLGFKYRLGLANTIGIIDSDYYYSDNEGHIMAKLVNNGDATVNLKKGDRFIQGIFLQYNVTDDDNASGTRNGGMGSTGV